MMSTGKRGIRKVALLLLLMLLIAVSAVPVSAASMKGSKKNITTGQWRGTKTKIKYRCADKTYLKSGLYKINGKYYYFNKSGVVQTGWVRKGGKLFYFRKSGGKGVKGTMYRGWHTIGGKRYFFRKTGAIGTIGSAVTSEWMTVNGQEYYLTQDGSQYTGVIRTEQEFVDMMGPLARADMKKSGILASVTIAQAILESGYGRTSLGMEANNLFGMKETLSSNTWASAWKGKTFTKKTLECYNGNWVTITAVFRAYDSIAESIADHSAYLAGAKNGTKLRYEGVVGNKDYKKTIQLIKNGGYATDPNYVYKICNIIERFNLPQYDKKK